MAALQQARMACDAVGLIDKESADSPKLDELCVQGGLKAVVCLQWQRMTELAERRLRAIGLGCVRLHGGVPTARRGELIERFRDDDAVQVFISTDAGGGLLVVLDHVDAAADEVAKTLSDDVPVAVIDPRTHAGVQRLGAASPLGATRSLYEAGADGRAAPGARLAAQAREKLRAAGLLLEQGCSGPAMELLVSALLAAAAAGAGLDTPPAPAGAAVWLYGEAVPRGWLDAPQAALVQRAIGLAQAPSLPEALLRGLHDEAGPFVG